MLWINRILIVAILIVITFSGIMMGIGKKSVVEIDNCEYLKFFTGYTYSYTHKGNCKYCEQRHFQVSDTTKK